MKAKTLFILNALIAVGYALAFFVAAGPLLAVYGIAPTAEAQFMARWFGVGLLAIGLSTWFARDAAESALGWIAVGFNASLGLGFGYFQFRGAGSGST